MRARRHLAANRRATHGRVVAAIFAVIGLACMGAGGWWAWLVHGRPEDGFAPYLLALAAAPCFALVGSLRVGAFVVQPSGESPVAEPAPVGLGWFEIDAWRPYRAMRNGAIVATAVFLIVGVAVFAAYAVLHAERPSPLAFLAFVVWSALTSRLIWGSIVRTWTSARIAEARLLVRPPRPAPGDTLHVKLEQRAIRPELVVHGVTLALVCERTWQVRRAGRVRTRHARVVVDSARVGGRHVISRERAMTAEHAFAIPARLAEEPGFLQFHVAVRTHLRGTDYRSRFVLRMA